MLTLFKKPTPPTYADIVQAQLEAARLALLDAEAEAERWVNTATMLKGRCGRLSGIPSPQG